MNTHTNNKHKTWKQIAILLLAVVILGSPTLVYPVGRDQGEYAWIAASAFQGKVVYRDIFNVKPPLTHITHVMALFLFGHHQIAIRILDLVWQGMTAFVIVKIANQIGQHPTVRILSGLVYLISYYTWDFWYIAQTDGFLTLPIAISISFFLKAQQSKKAWLYGFSGAAIGLAVLYKYPIGILAILLIILEAIRLGKKSLIPAAGMFTGFILPGMIGSLIMLVHGNFKDFIWTQTFFVSKYPAISATGSNYILSVIRGFGSAMLSSTALGWTSLCCGYGFFVGRKRSNPIQLFVIVIWWVAAAVHLGVQNKYYEYHFLPLLAPLALMIAQFLFEAIIFPQLFNFAIASLGLLLAVFPYFYSDFPGRYILLFSAISNKTSLNSIYSLDKFGPYNGGDFSSRANIDVADYIVSHTKPVESIFIWGFEPGIYFLSQRQNATRFIYNFPLYGPNTSLKLQQEFNLSIQAQKPVYILIVRNDAIPWVTATTEDSWAAFNSFEDFHNFVSENYHVETTIEDFTIYRINE